MLHHFEVVPYRCLLWASCNEKEAESLSHSTLSRRNLCRSLAGISRQVQGSGSLMIIVYHIPCESSLYIYVYIELVFFGVPILGLFRFTFCFLVTLNCPPPNPNARPQVISNAGSTAIYKLLARLCPCHESMSRKYAGLCPQVDHQAPAILLLP